MALEDGKARRDDLAEWEAVGLSPRLSVLTSGTPNRPPTSQKIPDDGNHRPHGGPDWQSD